MEGKNRFWRGFFFGAALFMALTLLAGTVGFFESRTLLQRLARAKAAQTEESRQTTAVSPTEESRPDKETEASRKTEAEPTEGPKETDAGEAAARLQEVADAMNEYFVLDSDADEMLLAALKAYVKAAGDPYTEYLTAAEFASMMEDTAGEYCGIGVRVQQNKTTMETTVLEVFTGSSAKEQGMLAGDILTAVGGEDVTQTDLDSIVKMIRGEEGTPVDVTVYRSWEDRSYTFTVERRVIQVETVSYRMLTADIGYLKLTDFEAVSAAQMKQALTALKAAGMKKLVMDLRNNPGGRLDSVLEIMDFFVDKDLLTFSMEDKQGQVYRYYSHNAPLFNGKMTVLVNGNSASASEVFTGTMKDYGRAEILGELTFGKGIVQSFFQLSDGSALKMTTEHYFTPGGHNIHGIGIEPDVQGKDDPTTEEDELLQLAVERLNK